MNHARPGPGQQAIARGRRAGMFRGERPVELRQFLRTEGAVRLKAARAADDAPPRPVAHRLAAGVLRVVRGQPRIEMVVRARGHAHDPAPGVLNQPIRPAAQADLPSLGQKRFAQGLEQSRCAVVIRLKEALGAHPAGLHDRILEFRAVADDEVEGFRPVLDERPGQFGVAEALARLEEVLKHGLRAVLDALRLL